MESPSTSRTLSASPPSHQSARLSRLDNPDTHLKSQIPQGVKVDDDDDDDDDDDNDDDDNDDDTHIHKYMKRSTNLIL